ncbi:MAG: autotransporter domain-containing protein [Pontiella sp.]
MKNHSTRNLLGRCGNKVMPLAAFAFFLSLAASYAQDNIVTGDAYGSVNGATITSVQDGTSDLTILSPTTTAINLTRTINGFININNNFSTFDLTAGTDGILMGSNTTALSVSDGTTLNITGGTFSGGTYNIGTNDWQGGEGAILSNVKTAFISSAIFAGQTITTDSSSTNGPPLPGAITPLNTSGSSGLVLANGTHAELTDSFIFGGTAGGANGFQTDILAIGGNGMELYNSSAVITNTSITGGGGGQATAYGTYSAYASGGDAIYATNSSLEIKDGTFQGGAAGEGSTNVTQGGYGLRAVGGSSITNYNGTFSGSDTHAVWLENSHLTSYGGDYNDGGLYSSTTESGINILNLQGGDFESIEFYNASSNGTQFVTITNITVANNITQQGGTVTITNLANSAFHHVTISDGTMIFTEDLDLSINSSFVLSDANSVAQFQALEVGNDSVVDIGQGLIEASGNVAVLSGAELNFKISANARGFMDIAGSLSFESNSTLNVDATFVSFSSGSNTVVLITADGGLVNTSNLNSTVKLTEDSSITGRTTYVEAFTGTDIAFQFTTLSLSNYWNATGQLEELAGELENLASPEMNIILNNLGANASKALVEETYLATMNTFQVAKQGLDAAMSLSLSRGTEFRAQQRLQKAKGSTGEDHWNFWAKYYGQFYHRNQQDLNAEYDAAIHGGAMGMDKSYGSLLVGISGGAGNYSIDTENNAEQSMNAFQAALYSTLGKDYSYLNAGLAYGFNAVESHTASELQLDGEFDAHLFSAYLGGGIGIELPRIGAVITPEASIRYTAYQQEAFKETSSVAVPRTFDDFDADSLAGSLGVNIAMLNTTALEHFAFKIEGRAHWIREFNPEPGDLSYQLVGGQNDYRIAYPLLDEDSIRLGIGFTFFNRGKNTKNNVLLRLDFDELFGEDFNSHNLSAKVIYAF